MMRLARLGPIGQETPVVLIEDDVYDLSSVTADIDAHFLASGLDVARDAIAAGTLPKLDPSGLRVGAPIARPTAVVCIGMNYAAHAAESGSEPPKEPVLFFKHPNTVIGPYDDVPLPADSTATDWEVELALVIGAPTYRVTDREAALAAVAGYTVVDDVSERVWQLERSGGQWSKGKCGPGFSPTGPWLVTSDEIDPGALRLRSWVNGEPRQDSSTADLIFDVADIIIDVSRYMQLEPGDLLLTGTPEGVALSGRFRYLQAGDTVATEIDGLGRQQHTFVSLEVSA